jgi:hypothetical protein
MILHFGMVPGCWQPVIVAGKCSGIVVIILHGRNSIPVSMSRAIPRLSVNEWRKNAKIARGDAVADE